MGGFQRAGNVISQYIGDFVPAIAEAFLAYHYALFEVGLNILGAIGQGIVDNKDRIQFIASGTITDMVLALKENAPAIIEGGLALLEALVGAIEENLPLIIETGAVIIGKLIEGITTASPGVQAIIATAVLPHILKIIDTVGQIGGAFDKVVKFVTGGEGIGKILSIGGKLMSGIKLLFGLIAAHPVIAIITAIITALVLLWTNCEEFRDIVKGVLEAVGGFFKSAYEVITGAFAGAVEFFGGVVDGIRAVFETVTSFLGEAFSAAWSAITAVWDAAVSFFTAIWDAISSAGSAAADAIGGALKAAWDAITSVWDGAVSFFNGVWDGIKGVFSDVWNHFLDIGGNIVNGIKDGIAGAWDAFMGWLDGKVGGIVSGVKAMLGIHSPSTVFAGIGENMALGLAEGWDDQYTSIKRQIENGMNFGTATVGVTANGAYKASGAGQDDGQFMVGANYTVNIYNPEKRDAVTEAREWKKTAQRMAMGYV